MRTKKNAFRIAALACAACLLAALLASCGAAQQQVDAAQQNREYMSSVNRISNEASEDLSTFSQAVSQGDVAAMRIAADDATETLSKISNLTAPDALKEVHEEYKAGVADLSKALDEYIELYAAASNASSGSGDDAQAGADGASAIDQAALKEVQDTYQSGIDHLSRADSLVAQIAGGGQSGQDSQAAQGSQASQGDQADAQSSSQDDAQQGQSDDQAQ